MYNSILLNTDSYKVCMNAIYPDNTTGVYSYIESRGGKYDKTVFFGLQAYIKEYLLKPITQEDIDLADEVWTAHGEPFNRAQWQYILDKHNGYLPVRIKAAPEGLVIPNKNVLVTIENTDPECYWLTTWLETSMLRAVWYPTTVCTLSWHIKQTIKSYLEKTGDVAGLDFKCADFGARGVSSHESAGIGAMAHLVNFKGTDTIAGVMYARKFYDCPMAGYSVVASEHSISTSFGKNEAEYVLKMLKTYGDGRIVSIVGDTYDIYAFCKMLYKNEEIKNLIIENSNKGSFTTIRPDSGIPSEVVLKCLTILEQGFGSTINSKGYKVLNHVRVIQGDGINEHSIKEILEAITSPKEYNSQRRLQQELDVHYNKVMKSDLSEKSKDVYHKLHTYWKNRRVSGFSVDNIVFGMGGQLLGAPQRDDLKFAMKASAVCIDGVWKEIFKDPITDKGKTSKKGRVTLYKGENGYYSDVENPDKESVLQTVFENGKLYNEITFDQVRHNSTL